MKLKYENLEHADLKIRAFGQTKEELFSNMAQGMFSNICDEQAKIKEQPVKIEIRMKANDLAILLVDYLNQLVYLSDLYNVVYNKFDLVILKNNNEWIAEGIIKGFKIKYFTKEIKAATYNELKLEEDQAGNFMAEVVFDI